MDGKRDLTSDMNNLKDFIEDKLIFERGYWRYKGIKEFSIDDLKELHYLTRLALIEKLCCEAGEIFSDILKESKND